MQENHDVEGIFQNRNAREFGWVQHRFDEQTRRPVIDTHGCMTRQPKWIRDKIYVTKKGTPPSLGISQEKLGTIIKGIARPGCDIWGAVLMAPG